MCQTPTPEDAPKYLKNSVTRPDGRVVDYACTHVDGRRVSLGRYGDPDGWIRFERIRDEWIAKNADRTPVGPDGLTVAELAELWLDYVLGRVNAGLIARKRYYAAKYAAEAAIVEHAGMPVIRFGPKALKTIQARLVVTPCKTNRGRYRDVATPPTLSRQEINYRIQGIRQLFQWGVSEELVPAAVLVSLQAVAGLRAGEARDNPARQAANPAHVRALVDELHARGHHGQAAALEVLRWTGCRPDEVCTLTAGDVAETPHGLELRIRKHKTRKTTGADRVVPLNDRAAAIVREALAAGRSIDPRRRLFLSKTGKPFNSEHFYCVLRRTADAAGIDRVEPYGTRHLGTTEAIEAGASEAEAAALLGHTPNSTVVRRYSQDRTALARRAANAIGGRETG
jgi:integrase